MDDSKRIQMQLDKHSTQIAKLFSKIDDTNDKIQKIFNMLIKLDILYMGVLLTF